MKKIIFEKIWSRQLAERVPLTLFKAVYDFKSKHIYGRNIL
jgi:hypothetical protein